MFDNAFGSYNVIYIKKWLASSIHDHVIKFELSGR